ncbi:hypothetical protein IID20_04265 [Patescibacteria group bacterium]|nr:hypothetical protein [Patescibacteria group bacterium]
MIENSIGAHLFQNFYVSIDGKKQDAMKGGRLSCSFFVSSILNNFNLINDIQLTVKKIIVDMKKSGWEKIKRKRKGSVVIWEEERCPDKDMLAWEKKIYQHGNVHQHIGFYVGNNQAISNSFKKRTPILHHWTFGSRSSKTYRRITDIFWHPKLNN